VSEQKHTPGPWHRDENYPIYVWGPDHKMVADLPSGDKEAYLARMRGVGRGATREEQDANCTLIAAAPDLLVALKALVKANEEWNAVVEASIGRPPGWFDSYLDESRAAIAKAEGRS